ncbi:transposase [Agrobacterium sp. S7/73]
MQRRKFSRERKLGAVKLVRERGVSVAWSEPLGLDHGTLKNWYTLRA